MNSSRRARGTRTRLSSEHACPELIVVPLTIAAIDSPKSASGSTIPADLPPSSSPMRLNCLAAISPRRRPVAVLPVKEILSMPGWDTRYSERSRPAGSTLTRPAGSAAASSASATA
jgi:hypothetical protein